MRKIFIHRPKKKRVINPFIPQPENLTSHTEPTEVIVCPPQEARGILDPKVMFGQLNIVYSHRMSRRGNKSTDGRSWGKLVSSVYTHDHTNKS